MQWLASFLADLLAKLIPWLFSGKTDKDVAHTEGLDGLDDVTGTGDLKPEDLPDI